MKLWRIATATRDYSPNELSGAGSARAPGRWNAAGERMVYAAQTLSLAVLETAAHVNANGLPMNRFVVALEVPDTVWAARFELDVSLLDATWQAIPAARASMEAGSQWLKSLASALLVVPSVIVPEEGAVLINPAHPDTAAIQPAVIRVFDYNRLLRR